MMRKFRWTFECSFPSHKLEEIYIKSPSNAKEDKTLKTIITDCFDKKEQMESLWNIIANSSHKFEDGKMELNGVTGTGILRLYDGIGTLMEQWNLDKISPTTIYFEDGYSCSDCYGVEITWKYNSAELILPNPPLA